MITFFFFVFVIISIIVSTVLMIVYLIVNAEFKGAKVLAFFIFVLLATLEVCLLSLRWR